MKNDNNIYYVIINKVMQFKEIVLIIFMSKILF
jgi:hypothetical protein